MSSGKRKRPVFDYFVARLTGALTKESAGYMQRFPHDIGRLHELLQPGDIVLVEGSQRVSEVIKYLTQSSWSHAALYVGDALLKSGHPDYVKMAEDFGDESGMLLVEANIEVGVAPVSISKYRRHNLRICRPIGLRHADLGTIIDSVVSQMGIEYDVDHLVDLLRYLFPVSLIPKRWRLTALEHTGEFSRKVICSSQIARAFQAVRYPILPSVAEGDARGPNGKWSRWMPRRFARRYDTTVFDVGVFTPVDPMTVTPRDFDLSPYFEVVKLHRSETRRFDYRALKWSDGAPPDQPAAAAPETPPTVELQKAG